MAEIGRKAAEPAPLPSTTAAIQEGRLRAVVDAILPVVDGGRFPVKRIAGEPVGIEAHCFTDGHDKLRVVLHWQAVGNSESYEVEMAAQVNDVWTAEIPPAGGRPLSVQRNGLGRSFRILAR